MYHSKSFLLDTGSPLVLNTPNETKGNTMKLVTYLEKFDLLNRVEAVAGNEFYDIKQWNFAINYRAKSRFGCCKPSQKLVEVTSEYYVHGGIKDGEMDDFINTLLHETAHVIVHERYGRFRYGRKVQAHGSEWRGIMRDLGITKIERCGSSDVLAKVRDKIAKHRYACKDCDYVYESQRALKNIHRRIHNGCGHKEHGGHFIHTQLR